MEVVPMSLFVRRLSTLTAVLAVAAVLVPTASAGLRQSVLPTLYVEYTMNCTFAISDDGGRRVSSIAPGTYQIYVITPTVFGSVDLSGIHDFTACKSFVQFQLTGPGVNAFTTLQDGDEDKDVLKETFRAGSTYTAQDMNQPSVARVVFTTSASGAPTAPNTPYTPSTASGSKSATSSGNVGLEVVPFRGTLDGKVTAAGKLSLSFKGSKVASLEAGRYKIVVDDKASKVGFLVQRKGQKPYTISPVAGVGKRSITLRLRAGQWSFFSPARQPAYFRVEG
jgi:hypothetical protein